MKLIRLEIFMDIMIQVVVFWVTTQCTYVVWYWKWKHHGHPCLYSTKSLHGVI